MVPKGNTSSPAGKAAKPYPEFPLTPHPTGRWCKKVRGKLVYFGPLADPDGALAKWLDQKDELLAGRVPRVKSDGFTIADLCNYFQNAKRLLVTGGEITKRTFDEYFATCERLVKTFGPTQTVDDLRPDDFDKLRAAVAKLWGPVRLGNEIQRVRTILKYGFDAGHIDRPVRFGPMFKKPSRTVLRKNRAARGPRMIEAADLRKLIDKAELPLKAMILLGVNGGLGNSDVGNLPLSAVDLKRGWINFPRPKTGIERRFPLWPETVRALKAAIAARPEPKAPETKGLVFVTKYGRPWAKTTPDSPVSKEFRKLLDETKLHRPGIGFYTLRHVFETVAGDTRDQVAVDHIMGHARDDMASVYRERVGDERLGAVVNHVRAWLPPPAEAKKKKERSHAAR